MVCKLVEMHGGTVDAQSAGLGKGSEFVVRLPVLRSPMGRSQTLSDEKERGPDSGWRVLVVDDNVDSADSIAMLLQMSGHEVRVSYSGPDAVETAVEYRPDIVLLDIGLPGIDGYEVARRLRKRPELREVKLIAVTGYGQEADRLQSQEAGFDYHLVKPVDAQKLQDLLVELMKKSSK